MGSSHRVPHGTSKSIGQSSVSHHFPIFYPLKVPFGGEKNDWQTHIWTGGPAGHEGFEKESVVIHSDAVMIFPPWILMFGNLLVISSDILFQRKQQLLMTPYWYSLGDIWWLEVTCFLLVIPFLWFQIRCFPSLQRVAVVGCAALNSGRCARCAPPSLSRTLCVWAYRQLPSRLIEPCSHNLPHVLYRMNQNEGNDVPCPDSKHESICLWCCEMPSKLL